MMELPFKYLPFLNDVIKDPMVIVLWAAFGMPALMVALIPITNLYTDSVYKKRINTIIFGSLGVIWITGFVLMLILISLEISGIKMYFIWILLVISIFIFTIFNSNAISKYIDTQILQKNKNGKR